MSDVLESLIGGRDLTEEEARGVMEEIMTGG
jgi:anthranilate phosphoribosyltransferase